MCCAGNSEFGISHSDFDFTINLACNNIEKTLTAGNITSWRGGGGGVIYLNFLSLRCTQRVRISGGVDIGNCVEFPLVSKKRE